MLPFTHLDHDIGEPRLGYSVVVFRVLPNLHVG
jgi:hypothetical protein